MKNSMYNQFIRQMYKKVTKKTAPEDMDEKTMGKAIIEQIGNRKIISTGNEQLLEVVFKNYVEFDNKDEKEKFIADMIGFQNRAEKPVFN